MRTLVQHLKYRFNCWKLGVDEKYVREAFSALCDLDLTEFKKVPQFGFEFLAWPGMIHINGPDYNCVINEGLPGEIYVQEYGEPRKVDWYETYWHEVFRTGKFVKNARFVEYLKILYGEKRHVQDTKSKSVGVRATEEKGYESHEALGPIRARPASIFIPPTVFKTDGISG